MAETWEQGPDETSKAFAAFVLYRDLPPDKRTLSEAARLVYGPKGVQKSGMVVGRIQEWARKYEWKERALEYDRHLANERQKAFEQETRDIGQRHAREAMAFERALLLPARALLEKLSREPNWMENYTALGVVELGRLVERASRAYALVARVERLARGLSEGSFDVTGEFSIEVSERRREMLKEVLQDGSKARRLDRVARDLTVVWDASRNGHDDDKEMTG